MKLKNPSLTIPPSLETLPSNSIAQDKAYNCSFVFEDFYSSYKKISASNPYAVFESLAELDEFLNSNSDFIALPDAGFAGYINYQQKYQDKLECQFAVYENISIQHSPKKQALANNFSTLKAKIIYPSAKKYQAIVEKCKEYIKAGDIYQANLCHKFLIELDSSNEINLANLYQKLCKANPAPYSGLLDFENFGIISSSPEKFLKISFDKDAYKISSSPIKGTSRLAELEEMLESQKEKAEHIMIVDLIRNDLSRIAKSGSVTVPELLQEHKFKNLYHYISTVEAEIKNEYLKDKYNFEKIFSATFPGGSITGTPKIRAQEIINELEAEHRGPYTGSMGYFKFNQCKGFGEFNILIRSIVLDKTKQEISFHTGSGITADSDPIKEYEETLLKAEKLLEVLK